MIVQINSDNQIDLHQDKIDHFKQRLESDLKRFASHITRVEVHLTDENSANKGGDDDIRCMMEARLAGHQPVSVDVRKANPEFAFREASTTLFRRLETMLAKERTKKRNSQREAMRSEGVLPDDE